jgi:hypothetical protein
MQDPCSWEILKYIYFNHLENYYVQNTLDSFAGNQKNRI